MMEKRRPNGQKARSAHGLLAWMLADLFLLI